MDAFACLKKKIVVGNYMKCLCELIDLILMVTCTYNLICHGEPLKRHKANCSATELSYSLIFF